MKGALQMQRIIRTTVVLCGLAGDPAAAQDRGPFVRVDLGVAVARSPVVDAGASVVATTPDAIIEESHLMDHGLGGRAFGAGAAGGYSWNRLRVEGEYLMRSTPTANGVHAAFANVLYGVRDTGGWRLSLGAGTGMQWVGGGFGHSDAGIPEPLLPQGGVPEIEDPTLLEPWAGPYAENRAAAGFQFIAALDRRLRESVSLATRVRWAGFRESIIEEPRLWSASAGLLFEF